MDEKLERGISFFGEVTEAACAESLRAQIDHPSFGSETARFSADFAFATIWDREGLARQQRSLVVLGILIALRQPEELKYHVQIALSNGLTVKELEEVLYQSLPYAGFPAANTAKHAMLEAFRDLGIDPDSTGR